VWFTDVTKIGNNSAHWKGKFCFLFIMFPQPKGKSLYNKPFWDRKRKWTYSNWVTKATGLKKIKHKIKPSYNTQEYWNVHEKVVWT